MVFTIIIYKDNQQHSHLPVVASIAAINKDESQIREHFKKKANSTSNQLIVESELSVNIICCCLPMTLKFFQVIVPRLVILSKTDLKKTNSLIEAFIKQIKQTSTTIT